MKLYEIIVYMLLVLLGVGCSDDDNFTLPVRLQEPLRTNEMVSNIIGYVLMGRIGWWKILITK